jgi:hypothetical protein
MTDFDRLAQFLRELDLPRPVRDRELRVITAISRIRLGEDPGSVCAELALQRRNVEQHVNKINSGGLEAYSL